MLVRGIGESLCVVEESLVSRHVPRSQKRSEILDPQDPGSGILHDIGSYIFIFPWDLRDLGSCHDNIPVDS